MTRTDASDLRSAVRDFVRASSNTGDDASGRELVRNAITRVRDGLEITGRISTGISRLNADAARMSDM